MLTIPEYFKQFINEKIDLDVTPKICCPFHEEDTPSFSYSASKGVWRCFGACNFGGDVYALHQKKFHFSKRSEAIADLNKRLGIKEEEILEEELSVKPVHENKITDRISLLQYQLNQALQNGDIDTICKVTQELTKYE